MASKKLMSVLGAAESGVGAAILAQKKGYEVYVSDSGTIKPKYKAMLEQYGLHYDEESTTRRSFSHLTKL